MATRSDLLTTEEAADLLKVSVRRVQQMLDAGELTRVARGLVDRASVDQYIASHRGGRRAWAEHTAWAAIALLSDERVDWIGEAERWRVQTTLRKVEVPDLIARLRNRAEVHSYQAHPSATQRLRADLISTNASGIGLVAATGDLVVDGYLATKRLDEVVRRYGLREASAGTVTLRATRFDLDVVSDLAASSDVLIAVDAATSVDPRVRGVGERVLADALEKFRT